MMYAFTPELPLREARYIARLGIFVYTNYDLSSVKQVSNSLFRSIVPLSLQSLVAMFFTHNDV